MLSGVQFLRCVVGALVTFAVLAFLFSVAVGGAMGVDSDGRYVAIGIAALLAPLGATVVGAWQARAAGVSRPLAGIGLAALVSLVLAVLVFFTNETTRDGFNLLQKILPLIGIAVGAGLYGTRWFATTSSR